MSCQHSARSGSRCRFALAAERQDVRQTDLVSRKAILSIGLVWLAYTVVGFLLYRERSLSTWTLLESDLVVFVLPAVCAFAALVFIVASGTRTAAPAVQRLMFAALVSSIAVAVGWCVYMLAALNRYGS